LNNAHELLFPEKLNCDLKEPEHGPDISSTTMSAFTQSFNEDIHLYPYQSLHDYIDGKIYKPMGD